MNDKLEEMLYDSLKPIDEPDSELNRQILKRRSMETMRKFNVRKTVAAAVICCIIVASGVTVYAASGHFSLLSFFNGESREVQERAQQLMETNVTQSESSNKEQAKWADFKVTEAICDNNQVLISVAATAADPERYLLVPDFLKLTDSMSDLGLKGSDGELSLEDYAKKAGKQCVRVNVGVECGAHSQSIDNHMESDGTLIFTIRFENTEKTKKLDYVCQTIVHPADSTSSKDVLRDYIDFSLTDQSIAAEVKYLPVSDTEVEGTNLVVDDVVFEKSDLGMVCKVNYHYTGAKEDWEKTKDYDICFYMLDEDGKIIEFSEGGSTVDGMNVTQNWQYSLTELPDTITFVAKDVMEKNLYGKVTVKIAE